MPENRIIRIAPSIRCLDCGAFLPIRDDYISDYFDGTSGRCLTCKTPLDWWESVLREIRENFMLMQAYAPIGAQWTGFTLVLRPGERTHYKLIDYGIPADAKILYVNYTPGGRVEPVEVPGRSITTLRPNRHEVTLWPVPWLNTEVPTDSVEVSVLISWVSHSPLDVSWGNLVTAFEAYAADDYPAAIVPANVAVEAALSVFLTDYLKGHRISNERIVSFLDDGATYSHQLNVLLPLVADWSQTPRLPDHIRGLLNRLRGLRNDVAHDGKPEMPLFKPETAELLCAAVFGFRYVTFLQSRIAPAAQP